MDSEIKAILEDLVELSRRAQVALMDSEEDIYAQRRKLICLVEDLPKQRQTHIDNSIEIGSNNASGTKGGNDTMTLLNVKGLSLGKKLRADGRYMGRFLQENGKYYPFYARTYEALEALALEIITGKRTIKKKEHPVAMTFREWAEKWLELYHKEAVSESVFKNNLGIFKNYIYPFLENKLINRLNGLDIQETIKACPHSRQRQILANLLSSCIRKAQELDIIKKDILKAVKKPRHSSEGGIPLTKAQEKVLLDALGNDDIREYIIVLLNSGLRRNEGLGLQRKHLNFETNEIVIAQQVDKNNKITPRLKTKTSRRVIKMFPAVRKILLRYKDVDAEARIFEFKPEYVSKAFKTVCKKIGLGWFMLKGCRTTFATRCDELGISSKVVQHWLGHANLDTTVNTYQKTTDDFIDQEFYKALSKFDTDFDTDFNG